MKLEENWANSFIVITYLTVKEDQIIVEVSPKLISFISFLGAIRYFAVKKKWLKNSVKKRK